MSQPEQPDFDTAGSRSPLSRSVSELQALVADLRARLTEAEQALDALHPRQAERNPGGPGPPPRQGLPQAPGAAADPRPGHRFGEPVHVLQDNLIQTIFGIGLELEECKRLIEQDRPAVIATVDRAIAGLNDVIREVRTHMLAGLAEEAPREQPTRPAN